MLHHMRTRLCTTSDSYTLGGVYGRRLDKGSAPDEKIHPATFAATVRFDRSGMHFRNNFCVSEVTSGMRCAPSSGGEVSPQRFFASRWWWRVRWGLSGRL